MTSEGPRLGKSELDSIKEPSDILKFDREARREARNHYLYELGREYFLGVQVYNVLQRKVLEMHRQSVLDESEISRSILKDYVDSVLKVYDLSEKNRYIVKQIVNVFYEQYIQVNRLRDVPANVLAEKLSANPEFIKNRKGDFEVVVFPVCVDFIFTDIEDLWLFAGIDATAQQDDDGRRTIGRSYEKDGVPITVSLKVNPKTLLHERQHKKHRLLNSDSSDSYVSKDWEVWDRTLCDEILARVVTGQEIDTIKTIISKFKSYNFQEIYDVPKDRYDLALSKGLDTIQSMRNLGYKNSEIVALLNREHLTNWPKAAERISHFARLAKEEDQM